MGGFIEKMMVNDNYIARKRVTEEAYVAYTLDPLDRGEGLCFMTL
jgi:hypothetical protein